MWHRVEVNKGVGRVEGKLIFGWLVSESAGVTKNILTNDIPDSYPRF